jgi:20S proteasome alpha/beta subunit
LKIKGFNMATFLLERPKIDRPKRQDLKPKLEYYCAVTIAIGFNCSDALLLCADTEVTTPGISKLTSSKLFRREYKNGIRSAIAYSGNLGYGRMAMQHIEQILEAMGRKTSTILGMRKKIEEEIFQLKTKHIYPHPDKPYGFIDFDLLMGLWSPVDAIAALLWTQETAVNELLGYSAIGAGEYLAHYLLRPRYKSTMLEQDVRPLTIEAITKVNNFVPGCGGFIELLRLGRDGFLGQVERLNISRSDLINPTVPQSPQ